jgi:phage protein D
MALADPPLLYTAQPVIEIDGQSYPLVARNLDRFRATEALGGLSTLEASFLDEAVQADGSAGHAAGGDSPLKLGAGIRIFAGAAEVGASEVFDGQITAIEGEVREGAAPLFTVLAEDRLLPTRRKRRTRLFEAKTAKDVMEQIASDHGLTPEIRDGIDTTSTDWLQSDETDLAFLRRILARCDADVQVVGDKMQVGRIGKDQRTLVNLAPGATLKTARITADIAEQVSEIRLASYDPATGEKVDTNATAGGFGPGSGKTGADVLGEKFSAVTMHLGRYGPMTDAAAQNLAQYQADRRARAFVTVTGTAQGNSQIRVGSWVDIAHVNAQFCNQYSVTKAIHRWDHRDGYLTDFEAQSAYLGEPA